MDDLDFGAETEIKYCLSSARSLLNDDGVSVEDRSTLADAWMRLAEAWSDRAADLFEVDDEDEDEIAEQQRLLSEQRD